jgi:hypothetical protein
MDSMPDGLGPPRWQLLPENFRVASGLPDYAVHHEAGTESFTAIVLQELATIAGTVRDHLGASTNHAFVRLQRLSPDAAYRAIDADLDASGSFAVRVYPGVWIVSAMPGLSKRAWQMVKLGDLPPPASANPLQGGPTPRPIIVDVGHAERREVDISFYRGSRRIRGLAMDQMQRPFSGLQVLLYYADVYDEMGAARDSGFVGGVDSTITSESGEFYFDALMPGRYRILMSPEGYNPCARPDQMTLGRISSAINLDATTGDADLGVVPVDRSDPVRVSGEVLLNPKWNATHQVPVTAVGAALVFKSGPAGDIETRCDLSIQSDGRFSGFIERLVSDVLLELRWGNEVMLVPIDQRTADTDLWLGVVGFPQM